MEINDQQTFFMLRCLQIAKLGKGTVAPNPLVGCVIAIEGKIIGEGFHQKFGSAHAEVNAINSVVDKSLLEKSTLYVNLEPCSHFGKTPPCTDSIINNKIKKVVIGMQDPFSRVNGSGIKKLRESGIEVIVGVLEDECRILNKRFTAFHQKKRPYLILKWAQSADGFIGRVNEKINISNSLSKIYSHKWRSEESAILIGSNTAKSDNPLLNTREWKGNNPTRILIDNNGKLNADLNIFDGSQQTIVLSNKSINNYPNSKHIAISEGSFLDQALSKLHEEGIQSIIVEGGKKTLQSFIDTGFWDEAKVFQSELLLKNGIKAPIINFPANNFEKLNDNILIHYKNQNI